MAGEANTYAITVNGDSYVVRPKGELVFTVESDVKTSATSETIKAEILDGKPGQVTVEGYTVKYAAPVEVTEAVNVKIRISATATVGGVEYSSGNKDVSIVVQLPILSNLKVANIDVKSKQRRLDISIIKSAAEAENQQILARVLPIEEIKTFGQTDTVTSTVSMENAKETARGKVPSGADIDRWVNVEVNMGGVGLTSEEVTVQATQVGVSTEEQARTQAQAKLPQAAKNTNWVRTANTAAVSKTTSTVSGKNSKSEAESAARALVPEGSVNVQVSSSSSTGQSVSVTWGYSQSGENGKHIPGQSYRYSEGLFTKDEAERDARVKLLEKYPNVTSVTVSSNNYYYGNYDYKWCASATGTFAVWSAYATYTQPGTYGGYFTYDLDPFYSGYYVYSSAGKVYTPEATGATLQEAESAARALVPSSGKDIKVTSSQVGDIWKAVASYTGPKLNEKGEEVFMASIGEVSVNNDTSTVTYTLPEPVKVNNEVVIELKAQGQYAGKSETTPAKEATLISLAVSPTVETSVPSNAVTLSPLELATIKNALDKPNTPVLSLSVADYLVIANKYIVPGDKNKKLTSVTWNIAKDVNFTTLVSVDGRTDIITNSRTLSLTKEILSDATSLYIRAKYTDNTNTTSVNWGKTLEISRDQINTMLSNMLEIPTYRVDNRKILISIPELQNLESKTPTYEIEVYGDAGLTHKLDAVSSSLDGKQYIYTNYGLASLPFDKFYVRARYKLENKVSPWSVITPILKTDLYAAIGDGMRPYGSYSPIDDLNNITKGNYSLGYYGLVTTGSKDSQYPTKLRDDRFYTGHWYNGHPYEVGMQCIWYESQPNVMDGNQIYITDQSQYDNYKLYRCIKAHTNQLPTNSEFWVLDNDNTLPTYEWVLDKEQIGLGLQDNNADGYSTDGVVTGSLINNDQGYLKVSYEGKTLYIGKKCAVTGCCWSDLAKGHITAGYRTQRIGQELYYMRLLTEEEYTNIFGKLVNEWGLYSKSDLDLEREEWILDKQVGANRNTMTNISTKNSRSCKSRKYNYRIVLELIPHGLEPFGNTVALEALPKADNEKFQYDPYVDSGYFGKVSASNFVDINSFVNTTCAGLSGTNDITTAFNGYYKFYWHGSIILRPNCGGKRTSVSYQTMAAADKHFAYDVSGKGKSTVNIRNINWMVTNIGISRTYPIARERSAYKNGNSAPAKYTQTGWMQGYNSQYYELIARLGKGHNGTTPNIFDNKNWKTGSGNINGMIAQGSKWASEYTYTIGESAYNYGSDGSLTSNNTTNIPFYLFNTLDCTSTSPVAVPPYSNSTNFWSFWSTFSLSYTNWFYGFRASVIYDIPSLLE